MDRRNFLVSFLLWILSFIFGYKVRGIELENIDNYAFGSKDGNKFSREIDKLNEHIENINKKPNISVNVKENPYNAKGDGTSNDTLAIQTAIDDVIASGGGKVEFPDGFYLIDNILVTLPQNYTEMSINLTLEGTGAAILFANPNKSDYVLKIESDLGKSTFMRSIKVSNIKIVGNRIINESSNTKRIDRKGVLVRQCQDVYFNDVWISQFTQEGLTLHDVYDSNFINTQIFNCGQGNADGTFKSGLTLTGSLDNSNACYFFGLHIEFCPIILQIDHGSRHNQFVGCKFEQGKVNPNHSNQSPITIKDSIENTFNSCFFVRNSETGNNGTNYFIFSNDKVINSSQKLTSFVNCQFSTPEGITTKWMNINFVNVESCIFNGTKGDYPFLFNNNNIFKNNKINIVTDKTTCYSVVGSQNIIKDNLIIFKTNTPTEGAFIKFVFGSQNNLIEDNIIEGKYFEPYEIDPRFNSFLENNVVVNKLYASREITKDTTPSLFFSVKVILLNYSSNVQITNLQFGYNGQEVILISKNNFPTIVHDINKIHLKDGINKNLITNQTIKLVNINGIWFEV